MYEYNKIQLKTFLSRPFDRRRFIARKLWDLTLQVHMIEKEGTQLSDVIGHVIKMMLHLYSEGIITR